jgi:hypothetical protein
MRRGVVNVDSLANDFLAGYDKVRALGGLFILSYHSQMLARPALVPALATVVRRIARDTTVWLATAGEVADWWLGRSVVITRARIVSPDRLALDVRNPGPTSMRGVVVRVATGASAAAAADNGVRVLPSDAGAIRLLMPPIAAGGLVHATITLAAPALPATGGGDAR